MAGLEDEHSPEPAVERDAERAAEARIDTRMDPAGTPIVTVAGELDISNAAELDAVVESVTAAHPERLIFDLSGLRFMDSAGIAVLVGATTKVSIVHLRDPSQIVRRVIELTGLAGVLPIES
jgi:anti-sigma B factor antagonist